MVMSRDRSILQPGISALCNMFIALLCSIFLFVLDYLWHDIIKRELLPGVGKNDILAVIFGGYMAVIVFVLFLALYAVSGMQMPCMKIICNR